MYADYRLPWLSMLSVNAGIYYSDRRVVDNRNTQFIPVLFLKRRLTLPIFRSPVESA